MKSSFFSASNKSSSQRTSKTSSYDKVINIHCTNESDDEDDDDEVVYNCTFVSPIVNVSQVKLKNTNFIFYNQFGNETHETKIIESSLAKDMKNNIQSQVYPLNISTFYFVNFTQINDDKVVLSPIVNSASPITKVPALICWLKPESSAVNFVDKVAL